MTRCEQTEFTEAWLLNAIDLVSFCIVEDGAVYAPILERLEAELQIIRNREDVVARARKYVEGRTVSLREIGLNTRPLPQTDRTSQCWSRPAPAEHSE